MNAFHRLLDTMGLPSLPVLLVVQARHVEQAMTKASCENSVENGAIAKERHLDEKPSPSKRMRGAADAQTRPHAEVISPQARPRSVHTSRLHAPSPQ